MIGITPNHNLDFLSKYDYIDEKTINYDNIEIGCGFKWKKL